MREFEGLELCLPDTGWLTISDAMQVIRAGTAEIFRANTLRRERSN